VRRMRKGGRRGRNEGRMVGAVRQGVRPKGPRPQLATNHVFMFDIGVKKGRGDVISCYQLNGMRSL